MQLNLVKNIDESRTKGSRPEPSHLRAAMGSTCPYSLHMLKLKLELASEKKPSAQSRAIRLLQRSS
ncbi:hypothetical protein EYF80_041632 [Liparis tanakae]|uniref:Uncharacterized protein n=1 Tax=Liparis tanakae TaxID=230148 RepID=A0A4Z2G6J8_9TELE|nr:hypothetical protein EYF80_041632 [Liparis tanakae]